jgi:hypothetical protein
VRKGSIFDIADSLFQTDPSTTNNNEKPKMLQRYPQFIRGSQNNPVWQAERLQGDLIVFYALTIKDHHYITHLCKAISDKHPQLEDIILKYSLSKVTASISSNTDIPHMQNRKYSSNILICRGKIQGQPVSADELHSLVKAITDFSNHWEFTPIPYGTTNAPRTLQPRTGTGRTHYHCLKECDITMDPPRKLADVVIVSDAINYLQSILPQFFNRDTYPEYIQFVEDYFPRPFHYQLKQFGFPTNQLDYSELKTYQQVHGQQIYYDPHRAADMQSAFI